MTSSTGIYARECPTLDRYVQLGLAQGRVLSVSVPREPDADAGTEHPLLDRIEAYLGGERDMFDDVRVALTVPTDRRAVLETVRTVPYGQTMTLEQLANMTPGDPEETTVSEALASNPAPILVPTHRVREGSDSLPDDVLRRLRAIEGL